MSGRAGVRAMAIDPALPDHVYAATGNQVFLSVDGGASYAPLPPIPTRSTIRSLAVLRSSAAVPPRLLVGTQSDGVFASGDGGVTYARFVVPGGMQVPGGPLLVPTAWRIVGAGGTDTVAFMYSGHLYRTEDGGATWRALDLPEAIGDAYTNLAVAPGGNVVFAGRVSGLFKSVDAGAHWSALAGGMPAAPYGSPALPVLDPADARKVTAIVPNVGIYRSDDGGASWRRTGDAPSQCCIYTGYASGDTLWLATNGGGQIHRSPDAGASWTVLPLSAHWPVFLRDAGSGRLFASAPESLPQPLVMRSLDGGDSWRADSAGLGSAPATSLAADAGRALYGVGGALHALSSPQGLWRNASPPSAYAHYPVLVTRPGELRTAGPPFWTSTDGGVTWTQTPSQTSDRLIYLSATEPGAPQIIYGVSERMGVSGHTVVVAALSPRRSADGGITWAPIEAGLPAFTYQLVATGEGRLIARTNAGMWFSADGGTSWRRIDGIDGFLRSLRARAGAPGTVYLVTSTGFYRSGDGGNAFTRMSDVPATDAQFVAPSDSGRVFVVTSAGDVHASENEGAKWTPLGGPTAAGEPIGSQNTSAVSDVVVSPWSASTLYAATTRGVLKFVAQPDVAVAKEFHHAAFDHYFLTASKSEAAKLSTALSPDWRATGRQFAVVRAGATVTAEPASQFPVCRFFSASFAPRSSHFYTPYADECAEVKSGSAWTYEGIAFALALPQGTPGARECAPGMQPLYRVYNNYADGAPNHRYTIDAGILDQMVAKGWIMEGEAATRVFACVPAQD